MPEANRTSVKFFMPGMEDRKPIPPRPLTQKEAIAYLNAQNFEDRVRDELIRRISRYPANTLNVALKNMQVMIMDINKKFKEQKDGQEDARS